MRLAEPLTREIEVAILEPHGVLQVAPVDLHEVPARAECPAADHAARDRVAEHHDLAPVP